jgi:hypothetical protein
MTGFGFNWPGDDEMYPERMRRYLEGEKAAVKQEIRAEEEARWDAASGPSAAWPEAEFQEWLEHGD